MAKSTSCPRKWEMVDESEAQRNKYAMRLKAKDFSIFLTTEGHLSRGIWLVCFCFVLVFLKNNPKSDIEKRLFKIGWGAVEVGRAEARLNCTEEWVWEQGNGLARAYLSF